MWFDFFQLWFKRSWKDHLLDLDVSSGPIVEAIMWKLRQETLRQQSTQEKHMVDFPALALATWTTWFTLGTVPLLRLQSTFPKRAPSFARCRIRQLKWLARVHWCKRDTSVHLSRMVWTLKPHMLSSSRSWTTWPSWLGSTCIGSAQTSCRRLPGSPTRWWRCSIPWVRCWATAGWSRWQTWLLRLVCTAASTQTSAGTRWGLLRGLWWLLDLSGIVPLLLHIP